MLRGANRNWEPPTADRAPFAWESEPGVPKPDNERWIASAVWAFKLAPGEDWAHCDQLHGKLVHPDSEPLIFGLHEHPDSVTARIAAWRTERLL